LLRDIKLSFMRDGQPRLWTVLLGENGLCKTTVLQAIGLAASGVDRANQLADIGSLPDRRLAKPEVVIGAEFSFGTQHHAERKYPGRADRPANTLRLRSELRLPFGWSVFHGASHYSPVEPGARAADPLREARGESQPPAAPTNLTLSASAADPLREARGESLAHWFAAGYGVQRTLTVPQLGLDYSDAVVERLATLFGKGRIIGTSFADLFAKTPLVQAFGKQLQTALIHGQHLLPRITDLELRGRGGVRKARDLVETHRFSFQAGDEAIKLPATWLSQGYQGMIAWVADLIGQQFWDVGKEVELSEMEGLLLIDELDLFLNPAWQVNLIPAFKATFPHMQFVVTTHSPMLLAGCERDEVIILQQDQAGNVEAREAPAAPALMSGSELYKVFFGVEGLYPNRAGNLLRQYGFLASSPYRSDEEEETVQKLRAQLQGLGVSPDWEPTPRRRK